MPIVIEEVTSEVATRSGDSSVETPMPESAPHDDTREQVRRDLSLLRERQARLLAD